MSSVANASMSDALFYTWCKKYSGMEIPEVKPLKSLEEEGADSGVAYPSHPDKDALQVTPWLKH